MLGTVVNAGAIAFGALVGIILRTGIPQKYKDTVMQALGIAVALIGIKMALQTRNELIVIISLAAGAVVGEALGIERALEKLGERLQKTLNSSDGDFVKGFVTCSLVYCVGAMSIMGALESGLTGQHKILFAKSLLDGISSIIFASTMGVGVIFSGLSVLFYQGGLTLLAGSVKVFMTEAVIAEMTSTGGLLILAISANILGLTKFKTANLLPAILVAAVLTLLVGGGQ
ncbi:MAG: DUF554 domain-containing protein [Peptococcaceae bacterium]|jgi:uncharacterized membrane protein YqgA involved in biofilm formation|nr:DUF554 domain-containing protein [Peptococcaceae bacterium]MDH7523810.1 DUF554 domain-containing protein [Peptococcaceae bacterium]